MRSALWSALLCGVGMSAAAQQRTVTFEEPSPVAITGFAVGRADYDRVSRSNTFTAGKIGLSLFKPVGDASLFAQLTTALEDGASSTEIDNLLVSWTPHTANKWSLAFGRFDAPIGFERDDEPLNLIPTTSFTFQNARPVKFTGLMARYTLNPKISVLGMIANGWDQVADNNSGKTAGFKLQVFPSSGLAVAGGVFYGPERDSTNGSPRTLFTGDATWQPVQRLILQAEAHHGAEAAAHWTGVVGQAFWRVGRSTGLTVRGEVMDDPDGVRTGTVQKLSSVTISPWYFYREAQEGVFSNVEFTSFRLPAFSIRPAVRIDHSDQPVFKKKDGSLVRSNVTALVELVYLF